MASRSSKLSDTSSTKQTGKRKADGTNESRSHISGYLSDWSQTAHVESKDVGYSLTSRLSPNTICDVVDTFSEFKRWLVAETGFGGTLLIPRQKKLNLKFSDWIMRNVDTDARDIDLGNSTKLPFCDADVNNVFGVPNGPRSIRPKCKGLNTEGVDFIRNALGMNSKDNAHSLKAAEFFLMKNITITSSKIEKDCFKIAYVIFVMGHVLAPGTKHNYSTIDFWHALEDADNIQQYNWCGYIIEEILKAVTKLRMDIASNPSTAHLASCHLFLQVFYLDNLDLGELNKKHDTIPRIADFHYNHIKRTINMAASVGVQEVSFTAAMLRPPGLVIYRRVQQQKLAKPTSPMAVRSIPEVPYNATNDHTPHLVTPVATAYQPSVVFSSRSSFSQLGPMDYSRHLSRAHPVLAQDGLSILLREYMAKQVLSATTLRNTQIKDMTDFTDKLASKLAERCLCCSKRGFQDCILKPPDGTKANHQGIQGRRLETEIEKEVTIEGMSSSKRTTIQQGTIGHQQARCTSSSPAGTTSAAFSSAAELRNRDASGPKPSSHMQPLTTASNSPIEDMCSRARDLAESISLIYKDQCTSPGHVLAGDILTINHEKTSFIVDLPWANNWFPDEISFFLLGPSGYGKLLNYISKLPACHTSKIWITHEYPRMLQITGLSIRKQLIGNYPMDHELGTGIIRRLMQINLIECKEAGVSPWSCYMEPDFAVNSLAGLDCAMITSCRNQLVRHDFTVNSCWLFHTPLLLPDGWCNFAFEMPNKIISVMDPTAGYRGISSHRRRKLEVAADIILASLFHCLNTFFSIWPVDQSNWTKRFPIMMDSTYSREDSGVCVTFFIKNFGGKDLSLPVCKDNINIHRQMILHQLMMLQGNTSNLAQEHLRASKSDEQALSD